MAEATIPLASFCCQAGGIMFYDLLPSTLLPGAPLGVELEPSNPYDPNCVSLSSHGSKLGHLAREAAASLVPLLRCGLVAHG